MEWYSRGRVYYAVRIWATRVPRHARWTPVDFYLHRSVRNSAQVRRVDLPFPGANWGLSSCRILWAFEVRRAADGSPVDPTKTVNLGLTRMPAPFHISVRARHAGARHLIESESHDAEIRLREWEY